jgi:hypothetical protein
MSEMVHSFGSKFVLSHQLRKTALAARRERGSRISTHDSAVSERHLAHFTVLSLDSFMLLGWRSDIFEGGFVCQQIFDLDHAEQEDRQQKDSRDLVDEEAAEQAVSL